MTVDPLALTRELVGIESTTGREGAAAEQMAVLLERLGYRVTRQPVSRDRFNVYAYREPPVVVFSTHLDTVPPYLPLREDAERLHGRGTCDAKGLAAAMVAAAEVLAAEGERRIGLLFVVGEENGSDGAKAAGALEPKGRYLINGEPTENVLTIGQKGALRVDLHASGRAAHSAYPSDGASAIDPLLDTIESIRRLPLPVDPLLGPSTLNVGLIEGGVAPNVIPPHASAQILIRTVEPTGPLRAAIEAAAHPAVRVTFPVELPFVKSAPPAAAGWRTGIVSFASDLPFHHAWGRGYQLGPGTIRVAHTDHESIGKAELVEGALLYARLARDLIREDVR